MKEERIFVFSDKDVGKDLRDKDDLLRAVLDLTILDTPERYYDLILYISYERGSIEVVHTILNEDNTNLMLRCYRHRCSSYFESLRKEREADEWAEHYMECMLVPENPQKREGPCRFDLLDFE